MLTKSLHTVTAALNVAAHLLTVNPGPHRYTAHTLAEHALGTLGHPVCCDSDAAANDPTIGRIVKACAVLVAS